MKLKWGDILVIVIIAIVVLAMFFSGIIADDPDNLIAEISHNGEVVYRINLSQLDEIKEIHFHDGKVKIIAQEGRIRFEESDCPDLVCVNTGWIKRRGRIAACLPNRILIKIIGYNDEVDVVVH